MAVNKQELSAGTTFNWKIVLCYTIIVNINWQQPIVMLYVYSRRLKSHSTYLPNLCPGLEFVLFCLVFFFTLLHKIHESQHLRRGHKHANIVTIPTSLSHLFFSSSLTLPHFPPSLFSLITLFLPFLDWLWVSESSQDYLSFHFRSTDFSLLSLRLWRSLRLW